MDTSEYAFCNISKKDIEETLGDHQPRCRKIVSSSPESIQKQLTSDMKNDCNAVNVMCSPSSNPIQLDSSKLKCFLQAVEFGITKMDIQRRAVVSNIAAYVSETYVSCEFCKQSFNEKDFELHVETCDFSLVNCQQCKVRITRQCLPYHLKEMCTKRLISCVYCETEIMADILPRHLETCKLAPVYCENKCSEQIPRIKLFEHIVQTCPKRIVKCVHCLGNVEAQKLDKHHALCFKCPVDCPSGCGDKILR